MHPELPEIVITGPDHERLSDLLATLPESHPVGAQLTAELDRAEVVEPEEIPPDVVTMNSRVVVEELATSDRHVLTLVYPSAADFSQGRLSILAPVGAALLGLRAGQTIDWPLRDGRRKQVRVVEVEWQPQAAGEPQV